jgi:catechol 2,3-dioxygenase-like lactoylglutathione lyase family enzyme
MVPTSWGIGSCEDSSEAVMECKIELIFIPVTDVDKAIDFYVNKVGFTLDMQARVDEHTRFVQVTPPTSACSIAFGEGITDMTPGTQNSIQVVVTDAEAARRELVERGVDAPEVKTLAWGSFTSFSDPDGNTWTLQQLPPPGSYDAPKA